MGEKPKKSMLNRDSMQKVLAFSALIALIVIFSIANKNFRTMNNVISILFATSTTGILALGVTFILVSGGNDLSIGTNMTFSAVICGLTINALIKATQIPVPAANSFTVFLIIIAGIIAAVVAGSACGLFNGFMVAKMKLPAFIATLGTQMITKGLSLVFSGTKPIYFSDVPQYTQISQGSVVGKLVEKFLPSFQIPNAVIIFFILAIVASFLLSKTLLGRYNFAIGSNEEAARLSGINTDRWKMGIYALGGAFAGFAGVVMSARLNSAQPATGVGYELDAIAAAVIGGTSLNGGEGTILGTLIGSFIMTVLINGLRIIGVAQELQYVFTGGILIISVYMDIVRRREKK